MTGNEDMQQKVPRKARWDYTIGHQDAPPEEQVEIFKDFQDRDDLIRQISHDADGLKRNSWT